MIEDRKTKDVAMASEALNGELADLRGAAREAGRDFGELMFDALNDEHVPLNMIYPGECDAEQVVELAETMFAVGSRAESDLLEVVVPADATRPLDVWFLEATEEQVRAAIGRARGMLAGEA